MYHYRKQHGFTSIPNRLGDIYFSMCQWQNPCSGVLPSSYHHFQGGTHQKCRSKDKTGCRNCEESGRKYNGKKGKNNLRSRQAEIKRIVFLRTLPHNSTLKHGTFRPVVNNNPFSKTCRHFSPCRKDRGKIF